MELSAHHVGELVLELAPLTVGQRVLEVVGLPPRDLLIILEGEDERVRRVRISAEPGAARLHLQISRLNRRDTAKAPFFQRASELLEGGVLEGLERIGDDRIVRLTVRPAKGGERTALIAELLGRGANLCLLVGRKVDAVCLVPKGKEARERARLIPGEGYRPPSGGEPDRGQGPSLREVFPDPPEREGLAQLAPLSWRVEASLGSAAEERHLDALRKDLSARISRRRKGATKLLSGLHERSDAVHSAGRVRQDGELLMANLHALKRGMREALLSDWFEEGAPQRKLVLDPKLTPAENAERYFARYKKHVRALEHVPKEIELAERTLVSLEALAAKLEEAGSDPAAIEEEAVRERLLPRRQSAPSRSKQPAKRLPYKTFKGSHQSEIRVGRSAKDNDRLSLRESRGNDLWLHTRDAPGSHVVLRLQKGKEPNEDEILDAAHLALHFSPLRGARRAAIHVARCKEVRKPKKAPPGLVTLSGGRTLELRIEPERLERLLRGERRSGDRSR